MKKRKFENGGPTDDGIVRKRGLRAAGTDELVLDSRGMPILTVGEPDKETEEAIAKAEAKAKSRPYEEQPSVKESRLAKFISSFMKRRSPAPDVTNEIMRQRVRKLENLPGDVLKSRKNVSDNLIESVESSERRGPRSLNVDIGAPLAREFTRDLKKGGGSVTRGDGIAKRGKTKGRYI